MSDTNVAASAAPASTPSVASAATQAADQAQAAVQATQAIAQTAQPKQPASTKKKFQLKVDGQPENVELDLSNEEEIKKHLQLARVAQKRMQQFAEYENNVKSLFDLLQKDPIKVLNDPRLGITEETRQRMAEMIINNQIQEMQKTPEQREKEKLQRDYEEMKKKHEDAEKARVAAEQSRLQQQYSVQFDNEISDAIDKSGLPKTARTVKYFAEAMMFCVQNNIDLTAEDLAPLIYRQTMSDFRDLIGSLPDEEFEDFVGKDNISRLRKRSIQKIKQVAATAGQVRDTGASSRPAKEEPKTKVTAKDFFRGLGGANRNIKS